MSSEIQKLQISDLRGSYSLTRIVFLRCLACIYIIAFSVAYLQNKELIGDRGLLPLAAYMRRVAAGVEPADDWLARIRAAPTLFWTLAPGFDNVNWLLDAISIGGLCVSMAVLITGAANMLMMSCLWVLYFSLVAVGQTWYGFGWESLLLETGFLAVWSVPLFEVNQLPHNFQTPWLLVAGNRWLLFRVMLGAGLIKIRGDRCWTDLTCMNYFYATQPVPNPISYYVHQSPELIHKIETIGNHIVELIVPWFMLIPLRPVDLFVGVTQICFQCILVATGNLSFLNWLTMVPALFFFDDYFWSSFFSSKLCKKALLDQDVQIALPRSIFSRIRKALNLSICLLILYLSVPIVRNMASQNQIMNSSFDPFRLVNTYGAFGSVNKLRTEVVIFGTNSSDPSDPAAIWQEYEFQCKPGSVSKRPCFISPYHYRLDWLMWFLAFQPYQHNPWLLHLMGKLLSHPEDVQSLLAVNPFPLQTPPKFVVAAQFRYSFAQTGGHDALNGQWWSREYIGEYVPAVNYESLQPAYQHMGWDF